MSQDYSLNESASPQTQAADGYCWNPDCPNPQNSSAESNCRACGGALTLAERYRAVRSLGHGSNTRTWLAIDLTAIPPTSHSPLPTPHSPLSLCIIKQFWPQEQNLGHLLNQKIAQYSQVTSCTENLPKCRDWFAKNGCHYLVQDYISGDNLAIVLAKIQTFTTAQVWQLLIQILPILQSLQSCNFIHGDIKPETIICRSTASFLDSPRANSLNSNSSNTWVLVDIGLLPLENFGGGNPAYAAPEQLKGNPIPASDLYSLGMTCIHLLTGIHPFKLPIGTSNWNWQNYWLIDEKDYKNDLDNDWERQCLGNILDRMIAPSLDQRFHSAEDVITTIASFGKIIQPLDPIQSATWVCSATWQAHEGLFAQVNAIALAADGSMLATASDDKTLRLWPLPLELPPHPIILQGHEHSVTCVDFHPHHPHHLVSGSRDHTIKQWHGSTHSQPSSNSQPSGSLIQSWIGHSQDITVVRFSPDGNWIASGSKDRKVKLWCAATGKLLTELTGHRLAITAIAWNSQAWTANSIESVPMLATASADTKVQLWTMDTLPTPHSPSPHSPLPTFQRSQTLTAHTAAIRAIAFSPNGEFLATAGDDRSIRLWHLPSASCFRILSGHPWVISSLAFSADSEILMSGSWDKTVKVWEVRSGRQLEVLLGHTDCVTDLVLYETGMASTAIMISISRDRMIKQWNRIK